MGATFNVSTVNYRDQAYFNQFFQTSFDKYDRNRDGRIDYREFQPLINDMCNTIIQRYGNGPTVEKIRQAWYAMDRNQSGYITRQEFTTKARYEIERILSQPNYAQYPQQYPQQHPPHMPYQPQYQQPHPGFAPVPHGHGPMMYGPHY